ncbi:MAG: OmpH family outer membrane protein [Candidatus Marinimicrobia bacterium]|nr:OmpH family outer membrane protein [Candidatus Neomarinimicrobiota bacterium]
MKKAIWIGSLALVTLALARPAAAAEAATAHIHMARLIEKYYRTEQTVKRLEEQKAAYEAELKGFSERIEKLNEEYTSAREDALNTALSREMRDQRRDLAEQKRLERDDLVREAQGIARERSQRFDAQQQRMWRSIVDEVIEVVAEHARLQGLPAVLDSSARGDNGVQFMLYSDPRFDITDVILEKLNASRPVGGAAEPVAEPAPEPAAESTEAPPAADAQ